jgi:hypothetical protein
MARFEGTTRGAAQIEGVLRRTALANRSRLAAAVEPAYHSSICSPLDTPQGLGRGYFVSGGFDAE